MCPLVPAVVCVSILRTITPTHDAAMLLSILGLLLAGAEPSSYRAKIHLLGHALFESLVNLALLRRRADQGLWAQCYRLRLRLRMRCTVLCASL